MGPKRLFNPQQQVPVAWPAEPIVARAYLDQLQREDALDAETVRALDAALQAAEDALEAGERNRGLARQLGDLADQVNGDEASGRMASLGATLEGIAGRL